MAGSRGTEAGKQGIGPALGMAGGGIGTIAGLIQMTVGGSIPWLTGRKEEPIVLGIITMILSLTALYSSFRWKFPPADRDRNDVVILMGILAPAVVCFTTAGPLWFIPGPLLLVSSGILTGRMIEKRRGSTEENLIPFKGTHRAMVITGAGLILVPLLLGLLIPGLNLVKANVDGMEGGTEPLDHVWTIDSSGNRTSEELPGVLIMHLALPLSTVTAVLAGIFSKRSLGIGTSMALLVALLFFFMFIPNMLFNAGMDMVQFSEGHFGSISIGLVSVFLGTLLVLGSFLYHGRDGRKGEAD